MKSSASDVENHFLSALGLVDLTGPNTVNLDSKEAILIHAAAMNPNLPNILVTILNFSTSVPKMDRSDSSSLHRRTMGNSSKRMLTQFSRRLTALRLFTFEDYPRTGHALFEVSFRVQHDCPNTQFSQKHPDVRIVEWCNNKIHVMEVECPDIETFTRIEADLQSLLQWKGGKVLKKNFLEGNLQVVVKTCRCNKYPTSITEVIERNSCLTIPPETYYGGWEHYRVIGFRENDYKKMFQELSELGPIEMVEKKVLPENSLRDAFVISMNSVFSELTGKQVNTLLAALEYGYYQIPKKMKAEEVARKYHIPRTTFEEHLRKAESKVMRAIAPYVRLYTSEASRVLEPVPQITAK